jgi:hypothetical protein
MPRPRYDPSVDRQELRLLEEEFSTICESFSARGRLVRGSLQTLRRRCGKPRCRCTRGQLHETLVFVDRTSGGLVVRKANLRQYAELKKATDRYQSLRTLRARLRKLHREVLERCDRLLDYRLKEGKRFLSRRGRK